MGALSKSRQQKWETWAGHIQACLKSDLSQKDYCQKHGLKQNQFWYWQSKLKQSANPDAPTENPSPNDHRFIPVTIDHSTCPSGELVLVFPGGIQLTGMAPDNLAMVRRLVEVLK